jgi:hypothetical protein
MAQATNPEQQGMLDQLRKLMQQRGPMGKSSRGMRKEKASLGMPPQRKTGDVSADVISAANAKMALANQLRAQNAAMGKPPVMP